MPYKDRLKAREATKERVRRYREKRALHKGVTPSQAQGVTSGVTKVLPRIPGLKIEGHRIIGLANKQVSTLTSTPLPIYDWQIHKPGERVKVWNGGQFVEMIVPELDAEGQPVPLQSISKGIQSQVSSNLSGELSPVPKPEPKKRKYAIK